MLWWEFCAVCRRKFTSGARWEAESLARACAAGHEPADLSPSDPASLLERGIDAPTQVQTNRSET